VQDASTHGCFIVSEMFVYDSITSGKKPKAKKYSFDPPKGKGKDKESEKDGEIRPIPLEGSDIHGSDSDDDDEEEKALPECKYGEGCYRKNAEHFKEFSHPWLI